MSTTLQQMCTGSTLFSVICLAWKPGGGIIHPSLCLTKLKPDIVIMDNHMKALHIFELTMPLTRNTESRIKEKSDKCAHFLRDTTWYKCFVNCFVVTRTGYISTRNQKTLSLLHKFLDRALKKSIFLTNLNCLVWYES